MPKNVLFYFCDPCDLFMYTNEQGKKCSWTNLDGCLMQSKYPISQAIIYFFTDTLTILDSLKKRLPDQYKHIEFSFVCMNCDQYKMQYISDFIYENIIMSKNISQENEYFFIPPRHNFVRALLFYYGIVRNITIKYMIPIIPASVRSKQNEEVIIHPIDLSLYNTVIRNSQINLLSDSRFLMDGIATTNRYLLNTINEIENAVIYTKGPVLLYGSSGSGKTKIASRLARLLQNKKYVQGPFVEINCATLNTSLAASQLFGHVKGAFTGAVSNQKGLLATANNGVLFLDEIALLDMQCQGMLLRALENGSWYPIGSDTPVSAHFFLICASNVDLIKAAKEGNFREDLLARIAMWEFVLPDLKDRPEDLEANLDYELDNCSTQVFTSIIMRANAREKYLRFAKSPEAEWRYNFRDLHASVQRMAAHAEGGHITMENVEREISHLKNLWARWEGNALGSYPLCARFCRAEFYARLDRFELCQLETVLRQCLAAKNLAEAGRWLFQVSRGSKKTVNDSHRLRTYLQKYGITWKMLKEPGDNSIIPG